MILTSKNNPLIKETATLKEKKGRRQSGLFLVEGVKMAKECQESDLVLDRVFVSERYDGAPFENAVTVSEDVLRYLSDEKTPQGVVCRVKIPKRTLCPPSGKCLLLDGVSDPKNMGAIIRTANAAGYNELYLTDDCTDPFSPKSVRASMSGVFFTKLYFGTREEILNVLSGVPIVVADMDGENVFRFQAPEKFALVIGNEGNGVSDEVAKVAKNTVRIPMQNTQESLNAGVSAGILMYLLSKDEFTSEN
ncbi:MAG: RNA methyltransferase [Clostridia bacterium]|nr:RNA methyltransferase [Clostridia bacterium]